MSMETSIVLSELGFVLHHTIVIKSSETVLLVVASRVSCIVTLVLLKCALSILRSWNVVASDIIVMSAELIVALSIEIESLWVKEVSVWQDVEVVIVVLARSIFYLLACVLFDSGHRLQLTVDGMRFLVQHLDIFLTSSVAAISLLW